MDNADLPPEAAADDEQRVDTQNDVDSDDVNMFAEQSESEDGDGHGIDDANLFHEQSESEDSDDHGIDVTDVLGGGDDDDDGQSAAFGNPVCHERQAELVKDFLLSHESWTNWSTIMQNLDDEPDGDHLKYVRGCLDFDEKKDGAELPPSFDEFSEEKSTSSKDFLEKFSQVLLRPGMKFCGHIVVPGLSTQPNVVGGGNDDSEEAENGDTEGEEATNDDNTAEVIGVSLAGIEGDTNAQPRSVGESAEPETAGKSYELVVLDKRKDALGHSFMIASHSAYEDEQYVNIKVNIKEVESDGSKSAQLEVEYADGETCCFGHWNPEKFRIEGHVRQRVQATNDGIFHTSDAVTHVFTLYPCTSIFPKGFRSNVGAEANAKLDELTNESKGQDLSLSPFEQDIMSKDTRAIIAHRHRTFRELQCTLQNFVVMIQVLRMAASDVQKLSDIHAQRDLRENAAIIDDLNVKQKLLWKARNANWAKLLEESSMAGGERLCAEFRARAAILDKLSFETSHDRLSFIERWKVAKMDRSAAHDDWASREFLMQALATMVYVFDTSDHSGIYMNFGIRHRLHVSYECFDSAFRRAEERLAKDELTKYEIPLKGHQGLTGCFCIICQSALLDEDSSEDQLPGRLYKLPCSHSFHEQCVSQWLHDHSSCPVCRCDLKKGSASKET